MGTLFISQYTFFCINIHLLNSKLIYTYISLYVLIVPILILKTGMVKKWDFQSVLKNKFIIFDYLKLIFLLIAFLPCIKFLAENIK